MKWPDDFNPPVGTAQELQPGLRRILADNPSPMTYRGTNTYLLGNSDLAVIDPGPDAPGHLDAILAAVGPGQRISHIVITHSHRDHSTLAVPLARATGAPVLAFGDATAGRSAIMADLAASGLGGGGEGLDAGFVPDVTLADGALIEGAGWTLEVIHTPGHLGNHISLALGDACLTGDHVMGWASSIVSPPDGDVGDFMASCTRLKSRDWRVFYPGHGAPVTDPAGRLDWLMDHRRKRESAILGALAFSAATPQVLAARIYTETPRRMLGMATRNVFAHLVDLKQRQLITHDGPLSETAVFRRL
ncbi:MBL fold metallo-hydrolase [Marinibacterium sp. SX1]|uniref:MBL fold metallo-hydrolase n=1 Tax=Marinibacterium sp. SX1 TaxID=3388424 RepID=UPI003D173160